MGMETINSVKSRRSRWLIYALALQLLCPSALRLSAQDTAAPEPSPEEATPQRPERTDATSAKLIRNYLAASGGKAAHDSILNVRASGTVNEAGKTKTFTLVETRDGKRYLSYQWRHLGRDYHEIFVYDGLVTWQQQLKPKAGTAHTMSGTDAGHFAHQRWLLHPFVLPLSAKYVYKYQGKAPVKGRPAYIVVGYGPKNVRSWFYFDSETFLVTRYGGLGTIAGVKEYLDYRATHFDYRDGILLPETIELLAENDAFGTIQFEQIETNVTLDSSLFQMPPDRSPILRQRTTGTN